MKNVTLNGEVWSVFSTEKHGDMLVITGRRMEKREPVLVSGNYLGKGAYYTLLEAFAAYGKRFLVYLDIPYSIREPMRLWIRKNGLTDMAVFAEAEIETQIVFSEKIVVDAGFEGNYMIESRSRMVWGTRSAFLHYLKERFGE